RAWPQIVAGEHTLLAAPTGSGKTLAAFLVCIDRLVRESQSQTLAEGVQVVYVSPLKALSNDIRRNLQGPLEEIQAAAQATGVDLQPIRAVVRTGDTPARERQAMLRRPPHILVTTPESLYLLLTSPRGRELLRGVRSVIVDEIHALARDKRGSHLALTLERLEHLCLTPPQRIGLSATQRPIEEIARFLVGAARVDSAGNPECQIIDTGHVRELDLGVEVPRSELQAVCSHETWQEIYARLTELIQSHRSTLIFVNTRRMAERVAHHLEATLGESHVASHHGSLSREIRLKAEERFKNGDLKAIVATASLELGIDIGYIDLVCQIGSPRAIATFLQRVGRAGHSLHKIPKGRIFALTRDELLESYALVQAVRRRRLDRVQLPVAPLDILAQQIVAAVACDEWDETELFDRLRRAWPYRGLTRRDFDDVLEILSQGIAPSNRTGAHLHRDQIHGVLRPRRGARIAAITSGGAIPDNADYRVVTEGERTFVGTLNEDFALESLAGDVFQLGNTSWRILHVRGGEVTVQDAQGAAATIPFWLGEAPGRTLELSAEVSDFRAELARRAADSATTAVQWLREQLAADPWGAEQAVEYVAAQHAAIGLIPTQQRVVFERFFDESGGMQLVVHAPFGARVNRAWGLALRKCFCRNFDFELQASADDNGIVLSIGPQHSFPIEALFGMLHERNAEDVLVQALLAAPMFGIRWRWNVSRALAVLRQRAGRKVPPQLQRFRADDLLSAVFPMQSACFEHRTGDLEVPDHPLARQTVQDCLQEAMDFAAWVDVLRGIEQQQIELVARDTREPSPFSYELLNASPYAFLDDAPLEERRTRAVAARRSIRVEDVRDLGKLDPAAVELVRREAAPLVRNSEDLHDALLTAGALPASDDLEWANGFDQLVAQGRATASLRPAGPILWVAAERWPALASVFPDATASPPVTLPEALLARPVSSDEATAVLVRGRLDMSGPTTNLRISAELGLPIAAVEVALARLEGEGVALRGHFCDDLIGEQWCERRLLARIHRLTLSGLRKQIEPVEPQAFQRFLLRHHHVRGVARPLGVTGLRQVLDLLQGFEMPAGAWEQSILPTRIPDYDPAWLDELFQAGEVCWGRLQTPARDREAATSSSILTRVVPVSLLSRKELGWLLPEARRETLSQARGDARAVYEALAAHGALFFADLCAAAELLPAQLEQALGELAALGLVTADSFAPIRLAAERRTGTGAAGRRRAVLRARRTASPRSPGGRWSRFPPFTRPVEAQERLTRWAWLLLQRYGVVFRDVLSRESAAPAWQDLAPVYRRLEARGEIRGGRFVARVGGEQFALPDAVGKLRDQRAEPVDAEYDVIAAADPLNLVGILTPELRVPATRNNRVLFCNG
ncbi:MAG: DEAD/DEAH box helicase, partial [Planctomycetaceae bacterium]|nr:DEAD/DEAH box helicase [Planctomycetaceae bacterium]